MYTSTLRQVTICYYDVFNFLHVHIRFEIFWNHKVVCNGNCSINQNKTDQCKLFALTLYQYHTYPNHLTRIEESWTTVIYFKKKKTNRKISVAIYSACKMKKPQLVCAANNIQAALQNMLDFHHYFFSIITYICMFNLELCA